jgi:hypothetical protein
VPRAPDWSPQRTPAHAIAPVHAPRILGTLRQALQDLIVIKGFARCRIEPTVSAASSKPTKKQRNREIAGQLVSHTKRYSQARARHTGRREPRYPKGVYMSKLLSILVAALFATVSAGSFAASHGGAMKDDKKMEKKEEKKEMKKEEKKEDEEGR